jgi:hypothetical protein
MSVVILELTVAAGVAKFSTQPLLDDRISDIRVVHGGPTLSHYMDDGIFPGQVRGHV